MGERKLLCIGVCAHAHTHTREELSLLLLVLLFGPSSQLFYYMHIQSG